MAHAKRGDSIPTADGSLELDYFTDHGSEFVAVFTVFAKPLATVYVVFPPKAVVISSRIGLLGARRTSNRDKVLIRWILANMDKATAVRTFELANGRAVSSR